MPDLKPIPEGLVFSYDESDVCCHVCGQQTKIRPIQLSKHILRALWLANGNKTITPDMVREKLGASTYNNYTNLKHWGFLERVKEKEWCITWFGAAFLAGEISVPEIVWVYNDEPRIVAPERMGRMVFFQDVVPNVEKSRKSVAQDSINLTST